MTRPSTFAAACLATMVTVTAAWAEPVALPRLSAYLDSLELVHTTFTQLNADGSVDTGRMYLKRPGRARFEYDRPNDSLVVIGGSAIAIFDGDDDADPLQYPLNQSPLGLILSKDVDLSGSSAVVDHRQSGDRTLVVAQDPKHPEYGQIGLYFEADPIRLAEWIIVNGAGEQIRIELAPFETEQSLSVFLFSVENEIRKRDDSLRRDED